jgi:hypothetical protein
MHKIMIGTPSYGGVVTIEYLKSIIRLHEYDVQYTIALLSNPLLMQVRNDMFTSFVSDEMKDYSHLFFLDADIGVRPEDIVKLIEHDKPLIGAVFPKKVKPAGGEPVWNAGEVIEDCGDGTAKMGHIGAGCMCIRRDLALDIKKYAEDNEMMYVNNIEIPNVEPIDTYDVFRVGLINNIYAYEDYYFCHLIRNMGYDVYADYTINLKHVGSYVYEVDSEGKIRSDAELRNLQWRYPSFGAK